MLCAINAAAPEMNPSSTTIRPACAAPRITPGQHSDLKSADFGEYVEDVGSVRSVGRQRPFDDSDFPLELFVVATGSTSSHVTRRHPCDCRSDRRSHGRVADAHVSGTNQVCAKLSRLTSERHASPNTSLRLLTRHGGTTRNVPRASTDSNNPQQPATQDGPATASRPRHQRLSDRRSPCAPSH